MFSVVRAQVRVRVQVQRAKLRVVMVKGVTASVSGFRVRDICGVRVVR